MTDYHDLLQKHFSHQAGLYDHQTEWRENERILGCIAEMVGSTRGTAVDLGTGTGIIAQRISQLACSVVGVDISFQMLQRAKSKNLSVLQGNINHLPFRDRSVDLCSMRQVFHYLENEVDVVNEISRILKPAGVLICADVVVADEMDLAFWKEVKSIVQPLRRRVYGRRVHRDLLEPLGFKITQEQIVNIWREDSWGVFLQNVPADENLKLRLSQLLQSAEKGGVGFPFTLSESGVKYLQCWAITRTERATR